MTLEVVVLWTFLLRAQLLGDLRVTQIGHFTDQAACESVRSAHLQSAVSPVCFLTQVQIVR